MPVSPWKFHHVGVVAPHLETALAQMGSLLNFDPSTIAIVTDERQSCRLAFLEEARLELIEPIGEKSPARSFLNKGGGVYHVCYEVAGLEAELVRLREQEALVVCKPCPAPLFGDQRIAFVLLSGTLLELVEVSQPAAPPTPMPTIPVVKPEPGGRIPIWTEDSTFAIQALPAEFSAISRQVEVFLRAPSYGIGPQTGILLFVQGSPLLASEIYFQKLRQAWADQYDVIMLGVNYLGSHVRAKGIKYDIRQEHLDEIVKLLPEHLRAQVSPEDHADKEKILGLARGLDLSNHILLTPSETVDEEQEHIFDFGYIQAFDCLWALGAVWMKVQENCRFELNPRRIFVFGTSLGGYIAQMCNKFAPHTFALVADLSGLAAPSSHDFFPGTVRASLHHGPKVRTPQIPYYSMDSSNPRYLSYDALELRNLANLKHLAKMRSRGHCAKIRMFHGEDDELVPMASKKALTAAMRHFGFDAELYAFAEKDVDGVLIKNAGHGLGANIKLVFEKYCSEIVMGQSGPEENDFMLKPAFSLITGLGSYVIDYRSGLPHPSFHRIANNG